jgi:hypothetical protein
MDDGCETGAVAGPSVVRGSRGIGRCGRTGGPVGPKWPPGRAEILLEACLVDAEEELTTPPRPDAADDLLAYLTALTEFLTTSPAGLAYRALIGEAQHDPVVRDLVHHAGLLALSAHGVLQRVRS